MGVGPLPWHSFTGKLGKGVSDGGKIWDKSPTELARPRKLRTSETFVGVGALRIVSTDWLFGRIPRAEISKPENVISETLNMHFALFNVSPRS